MAANLLSSDKTRRRIHSVICRLIQVMADAKARGDDALELNCYRSIDQLKKLLRDIQ